MCENRELHQRSCFESPIVSVTLSDVNQNDNHVIFYHTEVRWLSKVWVLSRFLQLRKKIKRFLEDRNSDLLVCFESIEFIQMTAYLADIFHHLNELNLSLQGKRINMIKAS